MAPVEMGEYSLAVGATCAYLVVWYGFLANQLFMRAVAARSAMRRKVELSRFDYKCPEWEMADRTVANAMEQMVAFLLLLWLYAVFGNARVAGALGFVYVGFRFVYPILWSYGGQFTLLVELSTQPGYMVIGWYLVALSYTACTGQQLEPTATWMWPLFILLAWVAMMVVAWVALGGVLTQVCKVMFKLSGASSDLFDVQSELLPAGGESDIH